MKKQMGFVLLLLTLLGAGGHAARGARMTSLKRRPGGIIYQIRPNVAQATSKMADFRRSRNARQKKELGGGLLLETFDAPSGEEALADELVATGAVEFAEPDYKIPPALIPNDPFYGASWHLPKIDAPEAWDVRTGTGIVIAILDTGVRSTHPDLAGRLVPGWNVYDENSNTDDVDDHGTWVAGAAAAIGHNSVGVTGVAFNARIMPVRISDSDGIAFLSDMAEAVRFAADNGAQVVNMSFGPACGASAITASAHYLRSKNGVLIMSAGNSGDELSDEASGELTCVSATDSGDVITYFSSYGEAIDVSAPGENIWTTDRGGGYAAVSGTSFSSPITAGVYALMLSANPLLTPAQLDSFLFASVQDLGVAGRDDFYGHGRINAEEAVALALASADSTAPTVSITAPTDGSTLGGSVNLTATASDNISIAGVQFLINGVNQGSEDTSSPYSVSWNTTGAGDGLYTLYAVARDTTGNTSTATVSVTVDNTAPVISAVASTVAAATATVTWTTDEPADSQVEYGPTTGYGSFASLDSTMETSHSVALAGLTPLQTYHFRVISRDAVGNQRVSSDSTLTTIADTIAPAVSFLVPADGSEGIGTMLLSAAASDNVAVLGVRFLVDGADLAAEDTTSPFSVFWDSAKVSNGDRLLSVVARDGAGLTSTATIHVNVQNTEETAHPPRDVYTYPDPVPPGDQPTLRLFLGNDVDTLRITMYDIAGRMVESTEIPAVIAGIEGTRAYYEYRWDGQIPSGRYRILATGVGASGRSSVKGTVRVVR